MSGYIRQIQSSDGTPITAPTTINLASASMVVFANDAAYEAVYGAGSQGDAYFNSTELLIRQHDGTGWVSVSKEFNATSDGSTTGSDQDIAATRFDLIRFNQGSLVSVRSFDPAQHKIIYIVNDQDPQTLTLKNEDAGATAANRIVTGTGDDLIMEPGTTLPIVYDSESSRWRVAGGAGSGAGGLEIELIDNADSPVTAEIGKWYVTDTTGGAITINLPDLSAIAPSKDAGAAIRVSDCKANWNINDVTLVPFSGQSIDGEAADETQVLDVQSQYIWLAKESASNWCMDTNFQPVLEGSGGGTGTGAKNYVLSPDSASNVTDVGGASSSGTTTNLPEDVTKTEGVLCTITAGSIGDTSTWETNAFDEGNNGQMGAADGYWRTVAGYADGAASIQWYNSDTSEIIFSYDIPADSSGRISQIGDALKGLPMIAGENIKPRIYWNVTGEANGVVLSGLGTLADNALQGALTTDWKAFNPSSELGLTGITSRLQWRFDGGSLEVSGDFDHSGRDGNQVQIGLPSGFTIKLLGTTNTAIIGSFEHDQSSGVVTRRPIIARNGNSYVGVGIDTGVPSSALIEQAGTIVTAATGRASIYFKVPINEVNGSVMFGTEAQAQNARLQATLSGTQTISTTNFTHTVDFDAVSKVSGLVDNGDGTFDVLSTGEYRYSASLEIINTFTGSDNYFGIYNNSDSVFVGKRARVQTGVTNTTLPITNEVTLEAGKTYSLSFRRGGTSGTRRLSSGESAFSIERIPDKSSNATGFPFADQFPGEYGMVKMWEETIVLTNSGAGSYSGTFLCRRVGNLVTITSTATVTHNTGNNPGNSNVEIPEVFRPDSNIANAYYAASGAYSQFQINSAGSLSISHNSSRGNSIQAVSITYGVS